MAKTHLIEAIGEEIGLTKKGKEQPPRMEI